MMQPDPPPAAPASTTASSSASSRRSRHTPRTSSFDGASSEFASVLDPPTAASSASPSMAPSSATASRAHLSDQQLYDRIEEQLEQLDKKRLTLQQLVSSTRNMPLRSYHDTPYSSRIARSVESTRVDSARLAKKIHNLFKFVQQLQSAANNAAAANSSASSNTEPDAVIAKFQPLFQNYAAVSRILNGVCLESVAFEEEIAKGNVGGGGGTTQRKSPPGSANVSARRRQAAASSSSSASSTPSRHYEPSLDDFTPLDDDAPASKQQLEMVSSVESLPLLQVNGLDSYEAGKKKGEFMNLSSMVLDIADSFHALQAIAAQQQEAIDQTDHNVASAKAKSLQAELELRKASRYKAFGLVMAGGVTGAAIGGPIGALVGLKTGLSIGVGIGLMGAGGALIGAAAGKQIQKARFVPLSHLEEEAELTKLADRERENQLKQQQLKSIEAAASSSSSSRPSSKENSPRNVERKSCVRKCL